MSDLVSSHDSDGVVVLDGMSFFREETFFCVLIILKSNITMVDVWFLFWIVPSAFSWEQFDINNLSEIAEILGDFLFGAIIGELVDVDLVIGATFLNWYSLTCYIDVGQLEKIFLLCFSDFCVGVILVIFFWDDNFGSIKLAFGILLVECCGNLFFGFGVVDVRYFGEEDVGSWHG